MKFSILSLAFSLFLTVLVYLLLCSVANADPFLVCDPQPSVTQYRVVFDAGPAILSPAQPDGSARVDIANLTQGPHTGTIQAGAQYTLNGQPQPAWLWSTIVPFDLTVPATPAVAGIGLGP
jgi:hypothetical protein